MDFNPQASGTRRTLETQARGPGGVHRPPCVALGSAARLSLSCSLHRVSMFTACFPRDGVFPPSYKYLCCLFLKRGSFHWTQQSHGIKPSVLQRIHTPRLSRSLPSPVALMLTDRGPLASAGLFSPESVRPLSDWAEGFLLAHQGRSTFSLWGISHPGGRRLFPIGNPWCFILTRVRGSKS